MYILYILYMLIFIFSSLIGLLKNIEQTIGIVPCAML